MSNITAVCIASTCHACPNLKEACAHKCEHGLANRQIKHAELILSNATALICKYNISGQLCQNLKLCYLQDGLW